MNDCITTTEALRPVPVLGEMPLEAFLPSDSPELTIFSILEKQGRLGNFQVRMEAPGYDLGIPEQVFEARKTEGGYILGNKPHPPWPKLAIEFVPASSQIQLPVARMLIGPIDFSVDAEVLYTRMLFALNKAQRLTLYIEKIGEIALGVAPLSEQALTELIIRAKIARKVKYLEWFFRKNFSLPQQYTVGHLRDIDLVFRGLTEGEFISRAPDAILNIVPSAVDLNKPPFTGIGEFSQHIVDTEVNILDKRITVGPISFRLLKARLANPEDLTQISKNSDEPVPIRFDLIDNQFTCRFENYAQKSPKKLKEKLGSFRWELFRKRKEPEELIQLITEPLISQVSADEANHMAFGWLIANQMPDRFCPQEPELDSAAGCWHVPIFLVYSNGEGGRVGELKIDLWTGGVIACPSVEEMYEQSTALAQTILNAK